MNQHLVLIDYILKLEIHVKCRSRIVRNKVIRLVHNLKYVFTRWL